jgi:bifunctional non-homologous end joining protein LigD
MLAVAGELPERDADRFAVEMKWDGVRAVAYVSAESVQLFSRNDRDITVSYPELQTLAPAAGHDVVLDGEIVSMDDLGRPNFGRLQSRMHVVDSAKARRLSEHEPVSYLLFDVLRIGTETVLHVPYDDRRALLERLDIQGKFLEVPPSFTGDPQHAMQASREAGLEGVVCKRRDSGYSPGRRCADWIKVKHQRMQEVVIIGWEIGTGRRAEGIGALLLAVHVDGELRYAGQVGTGFTERALADLRRRLEPLATTRAPVRDAPSDVVSVARWVRPALVGEVVFGEWTADGRLRHPSWRGLRDDKNASDVVRE